MSWMEEQPLSDVQVAIQSQTIQTALEENTSKLSDTAFTSFLQNAPIPRVYLRQVGTQSVANNAATAIQWGQNSRLFDPYLMQITSDNTAIQVPINGFYSFDFYTKFDANGTYGGRFVQYATINSKELGAGAELVATAISDNIGFNNNGNMSVSLIYPMVAGDSFKIFVLHNGGAGRTTASGSTILVGSWIAPYSKYSTGAGGN